MSQNRDITFDMMKGIGIILVIIGHLARNHSIFRLDTHVP